ncbi:4-hydroxyphenylacetate 3-monooxygenase, oxygenase component [Halobacteriales archaeon QS_1_68_17]|nr:MAG: 4-hydroxyphenylacetate 3-monooxygenase, oxygenase component [Halobacteriales archaeon QS_1_68_17]
MPLRTKEEYVQSLRDSREVYYKGERIDDVTTHPATRGMIETQGELYDLQRDPEHRETLTYEEDGERYSVFYRRPESRDDLEARREASRLWMDYTCGVSGRAADFLASGVTGMAISHEHFDTGERDFGEHVLDYYEYCRENDVCLTHALVDPQIDRTEGSSFRLPDDGGDRPGVLRKVGEDDDGIVVSGARMLATLGPQAEEILVYPFGFYAPDEADQALAFAVPAAADGVRQICRPSLSGNDARNHPLSSRFDEMDSFVVFDEVHVPWERVFVDADPEVANGWRDTAYTNMALHQTSIKDLAKAEFAFGVAMMLAESTGVDEYFQVEAKLGEIATTIEQTRSCIVAGECQAAEFGDTGYVVPDGTSLSAVTSSFPDMYPRIIEIIRDVGGSGLIGVPAWEDLEAENPLGGDVETYFRGKDIDARERMGIQKLAFELAIGGMGGREELYERFYTGGPMRVKSNMYKNWEDKDALRRRVREYGLAGADRPRGGVESPAESTADDD